jgi:hypothetical protein
MASHSSDKDYPPMTNRVAYAPQDFERMCKQAERDSESRKLVVLMERVKRQIAKRDSNTPSAERMEIADRDSTIVRLPSRSVPLER